MSRKISHAMPSLAKAAVTSYLANCAVGAVAAHPRGRRFMRRIRWAHHALFVSTTVLTGAAAATAILGGHSARIPLALAQVPLALMPRVRGRSRAHPVVAAAAAPAYAVALLRIRGIIRPHVPTRTRPKH